MARGGVIRIEMARRGENDEPLAADLTLPISPSHHSEFGCLDFADVSPTWGDGWAGVQIVVGTRQAKDPRRAKQQRFLLELERSVALDLAQAIISAIPRSRDMDYNEWKIKAVPKD